MKAILVIMKVYSSIISSISNTKVNQCTNDIMLYNSSMSDKLSLSIIYRTSHVLLRIPSSIFSVTAKYTPFEIQEYNHSVIFVRCVT